MRELWPRRFLAISIGVAAGVVASMKVRTFWDSLVSIAAMFFYAAPSFWLGIMMIVLFSVKLGWLPASGFVSPFEDLRQSLATTVFCRLFSRRERAAAAALRAEKPGPGENCSEM